MPEEREKPRVPEGGDFETPETKAPEPREMLERPEVPKKLPAEPETAAEEKTTAPREEFLASIKEKKFEGNIFEEGMEVELEDIRNSKDLSGNQKVRAVREKAENLVEEAGVPEEDKDSSVDSLIAWMINKVMEK